jgi:hypothetical protein
VINFSTIDDFKILLEKKKEDIKLAVLKENKQLDLNEIFIEG